MLLAGIDSSILIMFFPMLIALIPSIIMLVITWRAMKAHESISESLRQLAQKDQQL